MISKDKSAGSLEKQYPFGAFCTGGDFYEQKETY